jgi:hypothetical protein
MLPPLILLPGRQTGLPPSMQQGCTMHTFLVDGDLTKIQAALDAAFATASNGAVRYMALSSKLCLSVAEIDKIYSLDPHDERRGWLSETDVTVWVLANREGTADVRWIPLWLFVDTGAAMATGREVYGFPKQIGQFEFSPKTAPARRFLTRALVLTVFSPQTQAEELPVIDIEPGPAPEGDAPATTFASLEELAQHAADRLRDAAVPPEAGLLEQARRDLIAGGGTMVFLKQFPDVAQAGRACYQAIIEAPATMSVFRTAWITPQPYRVRFWSYDSHPFFHQLGISPEPQDVGHGMGVELDFPVGLGTEIWKAEV